MRMTPTLAASSPHRKDWWMVKRDRLVGGDDVVVEGGDGLDAPVARALGIEGRGTDRVLHHGVVGEQGQPGLAVAGLHRGHRCLAQLAGRGHDSHLGDHVVGEPAEVVQLGLEHLGVRAHRVGPSEARRSRR